MNSITDSTGRENLTIGIAITVGLIAIGGLIKKVVQSNGSSDTEKKVGQQFTKTINNKRFVIVVGEGNQNQVIGTAQCVFGKDPASAYHVRPLTPDDHQILDSL
ncbi:MAG TPA: hypothetical protein VLE96_02480 [Chlamydiales bacterium]|nr:hypothetical protein [Chlamydiales bacterium]